MTSLQWLLKRQQIELGEKMKNRKENTNGR